MGVGVEMKHLRGYRRHLFLVPGLTNLVADVIHKTNVWLAAVLKHGFTKMLPKNLKVSTSKSHVGLSIWDQSK